MFVVLFTGCVHPHKGYHRGLRLGTTVAYHVLSVWSVLQLHCVIASASAVRFSMTDAICFVRPSFSAAPPALAPSSRHNCYGVHVDCLGFRAHKPRPSMTRNTVSTPPWCLICSLNSASLTAKFQTIPHPAFCGSTTFV